GTALSFDVLKRWLEKGEPPSSQYIRFFNSWLIYFLFFFIWVYHGLVPKLLVTHPVEMNMVTSLLSLSAGEAYWMVIGIGIGEIIYGLTWLLYRHKRRLFILQFILFPALTLSSIVASPSILVHPFTPLTLNSSLLVISIVGYLISKDLPTATSCKRRR
ncbi:MAG TPA: DoxX-like family protein, partial [Chondromyces sp.]|nr:DoxX-like family protein [Chondromyces sp.]